METIFDLFFPIIIILIVIFNIIKAIFPGRKGDGKKPSGWKQAFEDIVEQIQKEVNPDYSSAGSGTEQREHMVPEETPLEPKLQTVMKTKKKVSSIMEEEQETLKHRRSREEETERRKQDLKRKKAFSKASAFVKTARFSKKQLREAVIWAEILAPPIALRKPNERI